MSFYLNARFIKISNMYNIQKSKRIILSDSAVVLKRWFKELYGEVYISSTSIVIYLFFPLHNVMYKIMIQIYYS